MSNTIYDDIRKADNPFAIQRKERIELIEKIEQKLKCHVVVVYHNLKSPLSLLDDADAEMLEDVLSATVSNKKLLMIINSNGGFPLAAERIVHVARTFAPRGFETMVVRKAKSAATMVCLGSDKIHMCHTAELGPIDSQVIGPSGRRISVDSILDAYQKLMDELQTIDMNERNPVGLLQQLQSFDPSEIEEMRRIQALGRDMTGKFLSKHMMKGCGGEEIQNVVMAFSEAEAHKSHGRPVWADRAKDLGLKVAIIRHNNPFWHACHELLLRFDLLCTLEESTSDLHLVKAMETARTQHAQKAPAELKE
jgi:hypothetical protein